MLPLPICRAGQARRQLIVDEFGRLYTESQAWTPKKNRLEVLKLEIQSWYPELAADKTELAVGVVYEVQIGERAIEKSWKSMAAVYKAAGGLKPFLKLCSVTFKALAEVLGVPAAEGLQVEAQTGTRRLKAVARVTKVVELPKVA